MTNCFRDAALNLARSGFRIFPCRWHSKQPLINDNLARATTDPNIINGWWGAKGAYNIAIATGAASGIWVLDVDGADGERTLARLEIGHGRLPPTVEVATGNGRHLYWRWPSDGADGGIRNTQCRDDIPGLDVRGDGGYVLAPPSVHPSGRDYQWLSGSVEIANAPAWLLDIVTKRGIDLNKAAGAQAKPPEAWCSFLDSNADGSHRGAAVAQLTGLLLRKYIDPMIVLGIVRLFNTQRCNPPLEDDEIIGVVGEICQREKQRREARS
jgi:hypothetical protein